jgi:hypothetical protein
MGVASFSIENRPTLCGQLSLGHLQVNDRVVENLGVRDTVVREHARPWPLRRLVDLLNTPRGRRKLRSFANAHYYFTPQLAVSHVQEPPWFGFF